ncbi:hypothetical protein ABIC83_002402 [Roseateles asaccharophilus]|uniref:hypothetical protein n=1 Tax=Roseateles asaccharophilus TaxID=582607 RepID=UPI00383427FF
MKSAQVEIVDETMLSRVAKILGESSAAHLALEDAKARREAGQDVTIVKSGASILVVPSAALTDN